MNVYKLIYPDRATAVADLIDKSVISQDENYINGTQAVVHLGNMVMTPCTYNEQGDELTPMILDSNYSVDLMSSDEIDFGTARILPNNPKHGFLGFEN